MISHRLKIEYHRQNGVIYNIKTFRFKNQRKKKQQAKTNEMRRERREKWVRGQEIDAVSKNVASEQVFPKRTGNMKWYYLWIAQVKMGKHVSGNIRMLVAFNLYICEQASGRMSVCSILLGAIQNETCKTGFSQMDAVRTFFAGIQHTATKNLMLIH